MQTTIRFLDDLAKVGASILGLAFGVKDEVKSRLKAKAENIGRRMDFVTRDEFEVVRAMVQRAREENEKSSKRLDSLEHHHKKS